MRFTPASAHDKRHRLHITPGSKEYWLRGSAPKTDGWTRVYVPKTTGLPEESRTDDKDILVFMQRIKDNERTMKNAEKEMRKTGNYVGAVKLFDGMARLRRVEEQCRKMLIADLEDTRSKLYLATIREEAMRKRMKRAYTVLDEHNQNTAKALATKNSQIHALTVSS